MYYLLKHTDINVALLAINDDGNIISINEVYCPEHLPLSCVMESGKINARRLIRWWDERGIPVSRENFQSVMTEIAARGKNKLLLECRSLSLTDHYWVTRENDPDRWKNINFY